MKRFFWIISDLESIEKYQHDIINDFGDTIDIIDSYLLHMASGKFIVIDDEFDIIAVGKDRWFARVIDRRHEEFTKYFRQDELDTYESALKACRE